MKSAIDAVREVEALERKKAQEKADRSQAILEARNGYLQLSLWQKWITLPRFKRILKKETHIFKHAGEYLMYNSQMASVYGYDAIWVNYGAYLLEQQGFLQVKVQNDICGRPEIMGRCPRSPAEQVLFSTRTR